MVDVSGLNSIISHVYDEAAGAVVGAALAYTPHPADKPRIAISMYGITTPCVVHAQNILKPAAMNRSSSTPTVPAAKP